MVDNSGVTVLVSDVQGPVFNCQHGEEKEKQLTPNRLKRSESSSIIKKKISVNIYCITSFFFLTTREGSNRKTVN